MHASSQKTYENLLQILFSFPHLAISGAIDGEKIQLLKERKGHDISSHLEVLEPRLK